MLYDRSYMRSSFGGNESIVKQLILINIGIFIFLKIFDIWFKSSFVLDWFSLSSNDFQKGLIWKTLSYSFIHGSFLHIFMNLLSLYLIGSAVSNSLGKENFLKLYLGAALFGALIWLSLNWDSRGYLVGASGSIFGVMVFFCISHQDSELILFPLPIPIKAKWLGIVLVGWQLISLPNEINKTSNIAYSAHLGGALFGFLFYKFNFLRDFSFFQWKNQIKKKWNNHSKISKKSSKQFSLNIQNRDSLQIEVDRILDKINEKGFGSLTNDEKHTLDRARDLLKS